MIRAIWLEVVGDTPALSSRDKLQSAQNLILSLNISDVYLQVCRSGCCWYESQVGDQTPFEEIQAGAPSFSPVEEFLEWAESHGVRVHAWINVFNLGESYSQKIFKRFSPESFQHDNTGKSVTRYFEGEASEYILDAPGAWLDPACKEVRVHVRELVRELIESFPSLSGLHLDFFRYPYLLPIRPSSRVSVGRDFGYSREAIERFSQERPGELLCNENGKYQPTSYRNALTWDSWRRELLRGYLQDIRELLLESQELSVAVIPWSDRAYLSAYQDWRGWLDNGDVDAVHLMSYTLDNAMFRYLLRQAVAFQSEEAKVYAGVGAYLFSSELEMQEQLSIAEEEGVAGITLFSYRWMKNLLGID